jgi:membrane protein
VNGKLTAPVGRVLGLTKIRLKLRIIAQLLYHAGLSWNRDNAMRLSAAVAMYMILSLSPMLVITIKVLALVLNPEWATAQVHRQVESMLGPVGGQSAEAMIANTIRPDSGLILTIFSVAFLLVTASGVFNELRDALNAIWNLVPTTGRGIWATLRNRLLSVGMVFVLGLLLLVSHVLTVSLTVMSESVLGTKGWIAVAADFAASTIVIAALFGMLFRTLPDAWLGWKDVVFGSIVTTLLFKLGQYLLALYFAYGTTASLYGAAGSFVIVLLWLYYSCWIFFYGAELIQERIRMLGREIPPSRDAMHLSDHCAELRTLEKEKRWLGMGSETEPVVERPESY